MSQLLPVTTLKNKVNLQEPNQEEISLPVLQCQKICLSQLVRKLKIVYVPSSKFEARKLLFYVKLLVKIAANLLPKKLAVLTIFADSCHILQCCHLHFATKSVNYQCYAYTSLYKLVTEQPVVVQKHACAQKQVSYVCLLVTLKNKLL